MIIDKKTNKSIEIPAEPINTQYIVLSIDWLPYMSAPNLSSARLNELEFYNNTIKIPFTIVTGYDNVQNGLPGYWNSFTHWGIDNLNDGATAWNGNGNNSSIICYNHSTIGVLKWGDILIKFATHQSLTRAIIWIGDTYGGNPNKLVFSIQNDSSQPILNANKFSLRSNVRNIGSWDRNGVHRSVSEPITIPLN